MKRIELTLKFVAEVEEVPFDTIDVFGESEYIKEKSADDLYELLSRLGFKPNNINCLGLESKRV